jgi:hypothetical protein
MAKVSIATPEKAPVVTTARGRGEIETRAYFAGAKDPIHTHVHRLQPGARLELDGAPADRVGYVWQGAAEAGGVRLEPRSSVIAEYGSSIELTACAEGACVVEFTLRERRPNSREGGHVHLLPNEIVPRITNMNGIMEAGGGLHADAHCPSCELWLHESDFYVPDSHTPLHSHSEDEVIFILDGSMRLGARLFGPGCAVAIHAHTKYLFNVGPDGLSFVNFRGATPSYTPADGSAPLDSTKFWRTTLGSPPYLEPQAG